MMGKINKFETGNRLWYSRMEGPFDLDQAAEQARNEYDSDRAVEKAYIAFD